MAIKIKNQQEIELMRKSALLLSQTLGEVAKALKAGVSGMDLDKLAETFIRDNGGSPSFKGYDGFPGSLCISVNDEVVHGIPKKTAFKDGDVISLDCGVFMNGYHGDMAYTFGLGNVVSGADNITIGSGNNHSGFDSIVVKANDSAILEII